MLTLSVHSHTHAHTHTHTHMHTQIHTRAHTCTYTNVTCTYTHTHSYTHTHTHTHTHTYTYTYRVQQGLQEAEKKKQSEGLTRRLAHAEEVRKQVREKEKEKISTRTAFFEEGSKLDQEARERWVITTVEPLQLEFREHFAKVGNYIPLKLPSSQCLAFKPLLCLNSRPSSNRALRLLCLGAMVGFPKMAPKKIRAQLGIEPRTF